MNQDTQKNADRARGMIYGGFAVLGGVLCGLYGFAANRFTTGEILFLAVGGAAAGVALALICDGILMSLKK